MKNRTKTLVTGFALFLLAAGVYAAATPAAPFDNGRAPFNLEVQNEVIPYRVFGIYAMPGEVVQIHLHDPRARVVPGQAVLTAKTGVVRRVSKEKWTWTAPLTPGLSQIVARTNVGSVRLNAFIMVPATEIRHGSLDGYRIGSYPGKPLRGLDVYRPPTGFVEVTPENRDTLIAPHFTIGQFLCKQQGGYPKFVALRERLLLKLEYVLELVNGRGYRADTFYVMSGFRTPAYNTGLGNVRYSRHQWGDAADIFIDQSPKDGRMDDLNGDGRSDVRDAIALYDLIDSQFSVPEYGVYHGGLGNYGPTHSHGPFVHVDTRGFKARWGR
jgi:hypothetical protein